MATTGQGIGAAQLPTRASSALVPKETTTAWASLIVTTQVPTATPMPVPLTSHPAPDQALRKLPPADVAVRVTDAPVGKDAPQPVPVVPAVMVQAMPAGLEVTRRCHSRRPAQSREAARRCREPCGDGAVLVHGEHAGAGARR